MEYVHTIFNGRGLPHKVYIPEDALDEDYHDEEAEDDQQ